MRTTTLCLALAALIGPGCDDADDGGGGGGGQDAGASSSLNLTVDAPTAALAGQTIDVPFVIATPDGPAAGLQVEGEIEFGGGTAEAGLSDAEGRGVIRWTLGPSPVSQSLRVHVGPAQQTITLLAGQADPVPTSARFGDVPGWLMAEGVGGTTEDLAFTPEGLVLGVQGGLIRLDAEGAIERMALTGEALERPLGIARDLEGNLWIADGGRNALMKVAPDGTVSEALVDDGEQPLAGPNYVAVGPDGKVYLSDPCLARLIRFDPATGQVDATLLFDEATEGGPNGFAFRGDTLWIVTENTVLTCGHAGVAAVDAPVAGLFRVPVSDAGFGARETVAEALGVFGDGLALDEAGNVYVILDQVANLQLAESAVWVLPTGETSLRKVLVADGVLYANLAFGQGAFGPEQLYISLLSVPPFAGAASRGVERAPVGFAGWPLLLEVP